MRDFLIVAATDIQQSLTSLPKPEANQARIQTVINQVLITVGIIGVLMVIIGGVRYTISRGNPDQVAQAKDTIIYALVGLTITAFAGVIVRFVIGRL